MEETKEMCLHCLPENCGESIFRVDAGMFGEICFDMDLQNNAALQSYIIGINGGDDIYILEEVKIKYCPFCGRRLETTENE